LTNNRLRRVFPSRVWRLLVLALCLVFVLSQTLWPQEISRKIIFKTLPTVPALAKKMRLGGKVKVEVTVAPGGSVTSARLAGGSPVFEQSALQAVKQWKFERSDKETKGIIVIDFPND